MVRYDRAGDQHYDVISAFIKSMRGSDADAALHYLARMIEAGEDPRYIARRLIVHASEDVGMADPTALQTAIAAAQAVEFVGLPEARLNLAQAVIHIALAPKSNAVARAIWDAGADVQQGLAGPVPKHLRDASYAGAARLGHGKGYRYPHDDPAGVLEQQYAPDTLIGKRYYQPTTHGAEARYAERSERIRAILTGAAADAGKRRHGTGDARRRHRHRRRRHDDAGGTGAGPRAELRLAYSAPFLALRPIAMGRLAGGPTAAQASAIRSGAGRARTRGLPRRTRAHSQIDKEQAQMRGERQMNAGQLAALIAAGFFAVLACVAMYVLLRVARLVSAVTGMVTEYRDRADQLIEQAQAAVDRTNEQLARTDAITASMDQVTANMAELSGHVSALAGLARGISSAATAPLTGVSAFVFGLRRAMPCAGHCRWPRWPTVPDAA